MTAPPQLATAPLGASVEINGRRFNQQRVEVRYDHLPLQLLQPPARAKAVSLELATRGRHVGYLPGAGDDVAAALEQMGYEVTSLTGADLTPERLRGLDAVVIGIRAFNVTDGSRRALCPRCSRTSRPAARSSRSTTRSTACARAGSRRSSCTSRATA